MSEYFPNALQPQDKPVWLLKLACPIPETLQSRLKKQNEGNFVLYRKRRGGVTQNQEAY